MEIIEIYCCGGWLEEAPLVAAEAAEAVNLRIVGRGRTVARVEATEYIFLLEMKQG